MNRRGFLARVLWGVLCTIGAAISAYPVLSFITHKKITSKTVTFNPQDQASTVTYKEGVYLVKDGPTPYALSSTCTHLGCTLNYDVVAERFRCPCHGSVFDRSGKRLSGPATKDLRRIPLSQAENGDLVVVLEL